MQHQAQTAHEGCLPMLSKVYMHRDCQSWLLRRLRLLLTKYSHQYRKAQQPDRLGPYPSFFFTSSFTSSGRAWPLEAFMTWPTKKAAIVVLPPRYCSSCLGLAAITSSTIASMAALSVICCGFSRW